MFDWKRVIAILMTQFDMCAVSGSEDFPSYSKISHFLKPNVLPWPHYDDDDDDNEEEADDDDENEGDDNDSWKCNKTIKRYASSTTCILSLEGFRTSRLEAIEEQRT